MTSKIQEVKTLHFQNVSLKYSGTRILTYVGERGFFLNYLFENVSITFADTMNVFFQPKAHFCRKMSHHLIHLTVVHWNVDTTIIVFVEDK